MKHKIIVVMLLLFVLVGCLSACNDSVENNSDVPFEFTYSVEKTKYVKGDSIIVTVEAKNVGDDYAYVGADIDLFGPATMCFDSVNVEYELSTLPFSVTTDATERVLKHGETISYTYEFCSDEESRTGYYNMKFSFANVQQEMIGIIKIEEVMEMEEKDIREVADAAIKEKYSIDDLSPYDVEIGQNDKGEIFVEYDLMIGNYSTYESYYVNLSPDYRVEKISGDYGKYACYLKNATLEAIQNAETRMKEQIKDYDEMALYALTTREDGLYLFVEIIVQLDDAPSGQAGCNIDHEHKFFYERICGADDTSSTP